MKKGKLLCKILILIILILLYACNTCFAAQVQENIPEDAYDAGTSSTDGLPNLDDPGYKPTLSSTGKATTIISNILGALTVIGIIAIIIAISLIGFGTILGSASQKASNQEKYIGLLIAAGVIAFGSAIARMIISVAETI